MSTSTDRDLSRAIQEWSAIVGADHVITDRAALGAAETATFRHHSTIPLIVRPADRQQVQALPPRRQRQSRPRLSDQHRPQLGLWIARAGRRRLGPARSRPDEPDRRLQRGPRLRHGRTRRHPAAAVRFPPRQPTRASGWTRPAPALTASLIGNTMERGFGHTPYGDHFAHVCGFEVVLPDGECIETGFSRFAQASTGPLYRWGLGPTLDGLFTQSNFGIVTRMSIWLMPAPEHFEAFFFRCDDDSGLGDLLDALAAAAAERHAAERRAHRQRLQGAERHRPVSVGADRRHDAAQARADGRPSQEAALRRVERVGRPLWHARAGPRSEAPDAPGAPGQSGKAGIPRRSEAGAGAPVRQTVRAGHRLGHQRSARSRAPGVLTVEGRSDRGADGDAPTGASARRRPPTSIPIAIAAACCGARRSRRSKRGTANG